MPSYVYGCNKSKKHPRVDVSHGMLDNPSLFCEECGAGMHRVPQRLMGFYKNPQLVVARWLRENARLKKLGKPRPNKYRCIDPEGVKGKDFHTR